MMFLQVIIFTYFTNNYTEVINMRWEIVAVRKYNDGNIQSVKLDNGDVLSYDRAIEAVKEDLIDNVRVELDGQGREFLAPNAFINVPDELRDFPLF